MTGPGSLKTKTGGVRLLRPSSSQANASQDTTSEPPQNVAAATIEAQDPPRIQEVRGAKPVTNLFAGACLLNGALRAGVTPALA